MPLLNFLCHSIFKHDDQWSKVLLIACSTTFLSACGGTKSASNVFSAQSNDNTLSVIQNIDNRTIPPLPKHDLTLPDEVKLGARLFHDPRLSANKTISCANCHFINAGGDDNLQLSVGIEGRIGSLNSPTVLNSRFNFRQFWDGRADSLNEQIEGPIHNQKEMGASWPLIISRLKQDNFYVSSFSDIYSDGINARNIKSAITAFENALITPNSAFDRYLDGDHTVLTDKQIYGYQRFQELGCISCHQGINVGGNMYQKIGIVKDYFADRGKVTSSDYGLYNQTGREEDKFKFKVPSLRNIALTAPYFHDGQTPTLRLAIQKMAYYQLGEQLKDEDTLAIEAFLNSLTGEVNPALLTNVDAQQ